MDEQVYQVIGTQDGFFQTQEGQLRAYCNLFCIAPFRGEQSDTNHFKGHKALKFKCSSADVIKDTMFFDFGNPFFCGVAYSRLCKCCGRCSNS